MNPLRIRGEGYGRFDRFDVDLPEGTCAIVGPNGAGKSRLLNAVELALFAGRGELGQWLAPGADRLLLELEFEHAGATYRVRRVFQGGSRGRQTVDFECLSPLMAEQWGTLTRETAAATDELIVETLGLSRATFGASAFLAQGDADNFADASPATRKQILGEILDPHNLWPRLADRARADLKTAATDRLKLLGQIGAREDQLKALPDLERDVELFTEEEANAKGELASAEATLEEVQGQVVANAAAAERVRALTAAKAHAQTERDRVAGDLAAAKAAGDALADTSRELAEQQQTADRLPRLEEQAAEQQQLREQAAEATRVRDQQTDVARGHEETAARLRQEGERLGEQHKTLAARLAALRAAGDGEERCDRCEQLLGREAREAAIVSLAREVDELEAQIDAKVNVALDEQRWAEQSRAAAAAIVIPAVPDFDTAHLAEARGATARAAALAERVAALEAQAAAVPELTQLLEVRVREHDLAAAELDAAGDTAADAGALDLKLAAAKRQVDSCRATLTAAGHDLVRARQQLDQLAEVRRELDALAREESRVQARIDLLTLADRAFGRDGIPALIAENAIPAIEAKANEILELMPTAKGETLRLELRTQRELKSADHLKETLDVVVLDQHGARPYETYSGGEKGRLNVALRLALAQLLAHRRGAESRVLCLDEVEYLDQLGQEQLVDVVRSVGDAYDRVLVVSHAAGVRDAFETVIEIASDQDGVSYIAGAREQVAA